MAQAGDVVRSSEQRRDKIQWHVPMRGNYGVWSAISGGLRDGRPITIRSSRDMYSDVESFLLCISLVARFNSFHRLVRMIVAVHP